jgi:predicted amidohydrolase
MSRKVKIALAMQPPLPPHEPDRLEKTLDQIGKRIDQAADLDAELIAFPEMVTSDGAADIWQFEPLDGPSLAAASHKARQRGVYVVLPYLTLEAGCRYNSSILIGRDGTLAGHYHKMFPTHGELDQGILPGTQAPVFSTDFGRVGLSICFDLNYWEVGAEFCANQADLVIWSSMWDGARQLTRWSIEFGFAMAAVCSYNAMLVNQAGRETANLSRAALDRVGSAPLLTAEVDLDRRLLHHDFNLDRLPALFVKYGPTAASVEHLSQECLLLVRSQTAGVTTDDLIAEFGLETMRAYLARVRRDRQLALAGKYPLRP